LVKPLSPFIVHIHFIGTNEHVLVLKLHIAMVAGQVVGGNGRNDAQIARIAEVDDGDPSVKVAAAVEILVVAADGQHEPVTKHSRLVGADVGDRVEQNRIARVADIVSRNPSVAVQRVMNERIADQDRFTGDADITLRVRVGKDFTGPCIADEQGATRCAVTNVVGEHPGIIKLFVGAE